MAIRFARYGFAAGMLVFGLGMGGAQAGAFPPLAADGLGTAATPVAMCGYSCRSGGRYIPGPPGVCYAEGLRYCGSSRGGFDAGPRVRVYREERFERGRRGRDDDFGRRRGGGRDDDDVVVRGRAFTR